MRSELNCNPDREQGIDLPMLAYFGNGRHHNGRYKYGRGDQKPQPDRQFD